jgi:hypothetical protein
MRFISKLGGSSKLGGGYRVGVGEEEKSTTLGKDKELTSL